MVDCVCDVGRAAPAGVARLGACLGEPEAARTVGQARHRLCGPPHARHAAHGRQNLRSAPEPHINIRDL
eukprot:1195652-Prorocentrum_minimum.AAC.2